MKKRILSLLLSFCILISGLAVPAFADGQNAAIQTAVALGGLSADQTSELSSPLTRGQLAQLLTGFSAYRESAAAQGSAGRLFSDVDSSSSFAAVIRIAVQQGWMSGYSDGSFRPEKSVTLEEACTSVLKLLGYDVTSLAGSFPTAQLNKSSELGLRAGISRSQGEEKLLEPLYQRIKSQTNPAKNMIDLINSGVKLEEIIAEYQKNDLIIEEILDSRRLTYDTADDNTYIVEDFDGLNITIYTKNNKSENKNTVCVSSSSIGIGIPKWFFIEFYQGQSQSLPLTK